jgi:hypothetical protein
MKRCLKWISLCLTGALIGSTLVSCGERTTLTPSTPSQTSQTVIDQNNVGYQNYTPEALFLMLSMADDYSITYQATHIDSAGSEKETYLLEKDGQHLKHTLVGGEEWTVSYYDLEQQKSYWLNADGWEYEDFRNRMNVTDLLMRFLKIDCKMVFEDDNYQVSELSSNRFEIKEEVIKACLGDESLSGSGQMVRNGAEYSFQLRTEGQTTLDELSFTVKFQPLDIDMPTAEYSRFTGDISPLTPAQVLAELKNSKHCYFSIETNGSLANQQSVVRDGNIVELYENGNRRFVDLVKGYEYTEVNGEWKKQSIVTTSVWSSALAILDDPSFSFFFQDSRYEIEEPSSRYDLKDGTLLALMQSRGLTFTEGYMVHGQDLTANSFHFWLIGYGAMPGQNTTINIHIDLNGAMVELPM